MEAREEALELLSKMVMNADMAKNKPNVKDTHKCINMIIGKRYEVKVPD